VADKTRTEIATFPSRHVGISIRCPPDRVYAFASNPENLPKWASGLANGVSRLSDGSWSASSPMGPLTIRFAPPNPFGIMDHDVTLPSGKTFYNPMRVFANGTGSEVVFTLYRLDGMTDAQFETDAATIKKDLEMLKRLLEMTMKKT